MGVQGRATVDVDVKFASTREGGLESGVLRMVLDGYNAPITAGNFLDLVNRKFYDGMEVQRADGFVVQTGNPGGGVSLASSPLGAQTAHAYSMSSLKGAASTVCIDRLYTHCFQVWVWPTSC